MENVYNIRKEKSLFFVLDGNYVKKTSVGNKAAIIVNLYYEEDVLFYCDKMNNVPENMDIYVISSKESICLTVKEYFTKENRENVYTIEKQNRGRDISALLVAGAETFLQYEYVCFLHDKKEKSSSMKAETELWIENLWGNMIETSEYIHNIMRLFQENETLGLLVPPAPIGESSIAAYATRWEKNYKWVQSLIEELELNCNFSLEYPAITYGTVFWCRTKALKKLVQKGWRYEDFQQEPLPDDGTLSHAIERILAYVAQDAGYDTGTVMTSSYAAKEACMVQEQMRVTFKLLWEKMNISNVESVRRINDGWDELETFVTNNPEVYIYGAGIIGKQCLKVLRLMSVEPRGMLVTKYNNAERMIESIPIVEISELLDSRESAIIIAANEKNKEEISKYLCENGFKNTILF